MIFHIPERLLIRDWKKDLGTTIFGVTKAAANLLSETLRLEINLEAVEC